MKVSRRVYARMHQVSRQAIDEGVARGVIHLADDGLVDVEASNAVWARRREQFRSDSQATAAGELRREQAMLQITVAKVQMKRAQVDQLRAGLVERDPAQASLTMLVERLYAGLPALMRGVDPRVATALGEALELVADDLGDLHAEASKVTSGLGRSGRR